MSTDKGYIKLYRDIRDHWIWTDKDEPFDRLHAWVDLLMMMNHKDREIMFNGRLMTVQRGSRVTSLRKLAERWGWSIHKVSDFLNVLEQANMISQVRDSRKTLINVINYAFYQDANDVKGTPKGHRRNTQGTPKGHRRNAEGNKQDIKNNEEDIKKNEEEINLQSELTQQEIEEGGWGYE